MLLNSLSLFGQELKDTLQTKNYKNAVFVEILGATGYLSVNYERNFSLLKQLKIKPGVGVGNFIKSEKIPNVISYTFRIDLEYGNKRIKPVLGYAFSNNYDLANTATSYLVNAANLGVSFKLSNSFSILPKYYLLFIYEPESDVNYLLHWSGLQVKFNF